MRDDIKVFVNIIDWSKSFKDKALTLLKIDSLKNTYFENIEALLNDRTVS
jgi:hypothetical protein